MNNPEVSVPEVEGARHLCRHHSGQGKDTTIVADIASALQNLSLRMDEVERTASETSIRVDMHDASMQSIVSVAFRANTQDMTDNNDGAATDIESDDDEITGDKGQSSGSLKQEIFSTRGSSNPDDIGADNIEAHDMQGLGLVGISKVTSPRRSPRLIGSNSSASDFHPPGSFL